MSERLVASIELLPLIRKMIFTLIILEIKTTSVHKITNILKSARSSKVLRLL